MQDAEIRAGGGRHYMAARLRQAGLRPTRQRVELGRVIFSKGMRHISAEELRAEAELAGVRVSLATVYNALHQFTDAGLLIVVEIDGTLMYLETYFWYDV
jgi:Fur family iron response transcriptional regulator